MLVNQKLAQEIYDEAGTERVERAKRYVTQSRVEIKEAIYDDKDDFEIVGQVDGNYDDYTTRIRVAHGELEELSCECPDYEQRYGACKHIVATLMKFEQTRYWEKDYTAGENKHEKKQNVRYTTFRNIVNSLYNEELREINTEDLENVPLEKKVKIEPRIIYDRFETKLKLEFRIGITRMYKIKDLTEFYTRMTTNEFYRYGDKLEFVHTKENFTDDSQQILDFILKYSEMLKNAENTNKYSYYGSTLNHSNIVLGESSLDEVFDILKDLPTSSLKLLEKDPDIEFELSKINEDHYIIKPNRELFNIQVYHGKNYTYLLEDMTLYRCSKEFVDTTVKFIKIFKNAFVSELELGKDDLKDLYSIVMPKIGNCIKLKNIEEKEIEQYKPEKLVIKIYLDFDQNDYIIADVKFCYGDEEFNPLEENIQIKNTRNMLDENRNLNILRKTGFMVDKHNLRFILPEEDKIYNFLADYI